MAASPPAGVPPEVFTAALATFLRGARLDMSALAGELGVSRATLYRRAPSRSELLAEVVWYLTRHAMRRALLAGAGRSGAERVLAVVDALLHDVHGQPALRRLLENEPECALRILTSKHGPIQDGLCAALEDLLRAEERAGAMTLMLPADVMAYVIVRIGEAFLYADVIAGHAPDADLELAGQVIARLLTAQPSPTMQPATPLHGLLAPAATGPTRK